MLTNLAGNAVKFTDGGEVKIEASLLADEENAVLLRILVRDTGLGIPAERQADIFDSFTQIEGGNNRRHGGTGLGLAICLRLVQLMGGRIGLESQVGKGSTFWFEVTLGKGRIEAGIPAPSLNGVDHLGVNSRGTEQFKGFRVLLVEDSDVNRRVATGMAERIGLEVEAVCNGREAVSRFDPERHQLILMDVQMPEMDGFGATAAIRGAEEGTGRHVPIIAMTAHAMQGDRERCLAAGMDGYITKPVRSSALREALSSWFVNDKPPTSRPEQPGTAKFSSFSIQVLAESCGNDQDLISEIFDIMLKDTPPRLARLEAAIRERNEYQVSREAHGLKGAFVTVGAQTLAATCHDVMTLSEHGDFASAERAYQPIEQQWASLVTDVHRYMGTVTTPHELMPH